MLGYVEVGSKDQYIEDKLGQWRLKQSQRERDDEGWTQGSDNRKEK